MVVWRDGSALVLIKEVNLRRARLELGWVTESRFISQRRMFISVYNCHLHQLSLAIPSWVGAMSTSQRAMMPWWL